jgi:hypothetical protein
LAYRDEVFLDEKEMSLLYFGLDVFCQFEARVLEFDTMFSVVYTEQFTAVGGQG